MMSLHNIRVLDFTRVLSGPWATMLLGDLGAQIIKVEDPEKGDEARAFGPPFLEGESAYFLMVNRNKKSVTLNLRLQEAQEIVHSLVSHVDVVIHNFRPRFAERHGLSYETLKNLNPAIVYCSITGYGETGPYIDYPGNDLMVMGIGGAMSVTGEPDGLPVKSTISFADILAGYNAAVGILSALLARRDSDTGLKIEVNLLDSILATMVSPMSVYFATGQVPPRTSPDIGLQFAPAGTFSTKDGFINLAAHRDKHWDALCQALDMMDLRTDPRFCNVAQRIVNREELRQIMEGHLRTYTTNEWLEILRNQDVPAGPVQTIDQVAVDPQVLHNDMIVQLEHPTIGQLKMLGTPFNSSNQKEVGFQPPPLLGQHTDQVLIECLGLTDHALTELRKRKVI